MCSPCHCMVLTWFTSIRRCDRLAEGHNCMLWALDPWTDLSRDMAVCGCMLCVGLVGEWVRTFCFLYVTLCLLICFLYVKPFFTITINFTCVYDLIAYFTLQFVYNLPFYYVDIANCSRHACTVVFNDIQLFLADHFSVSFFISAHLLFVQCI